MTARLRDAGLVALLVLTLVLVSFALRSSRTAASERVGTPTTSASTSAPASAAVSPSASAQPSVEAIKAVFFGDSFAEGKGASAPDKRFTTVLSTSFGWTEDNRAHAGTGYLRSSQTNDCAGAPCQGFAAQVAGLAADPPAVVLISGGANDINLPAGEVETAVQETLRTLKTAAPSAKVYVINPWWDGRPMPEGLAPRTAAISAAAAAAGATFIDIGQPLRDNPALLTDGEANDRGHARLAELLGAQLTEAPRR